MNSGSEKRAALEYARSQGWLPPEELGVSLKISVGGHVDAEALERTKNSALSVLLPVQDDRIAELEARLAAETESHDVTKRALGRARKSKAAALESALRKMIAILDTTDLRITAEEDTALASARALLEP